MLIFSSASRTSSTLFGRPMLLMMFIPSLQRPLQPLFQRKLLVLDQPAAVRGHMQYVDGLVAFRRDQDEIHIAPLIRDGPADAIEQPGGVVGDDLDDGVFL